MITQNSYADCRFSIGAIATYEKETLVKFEDYVKSNETYEAEKIVLSGKLLSPRFVPLMLTWILTPVEVHASYVKVNAFIPYENFSEYLWTSKFDIYCQQ